MGRPGLGYFILLFFFLSCSAEKINLSPVGNFILNEGDDDTTYTFNERKNLIVYSSEITNLVSSFPKFRNDAVNTEVGHLKIHLKDYIGALQNYNFNELYTAEKKFEKSYKKLQKLRKYLNSDDDQVLNRYLVRIKTNMTLLESYISKDSLSVPLKN
jgi:hypothetical protein